ncbi:MAG: glycine reductase [Desulfitibacter sp. BRH_c19]|nr:MAG: glycine reductase [Desulfitibacter sp. BRH_c19]
MDNIAIKSSIGDIFEEIANALETGTFGSKTRVGITILGSELGKDEIVSGAEKAQNSNPDLEVVVIGHGVETKLEIIEAIDEKHAHKLMDEMLCSGELNAAVTMHYNFPIGVSTVGKVITPGKGKEMYLATTTGTSATERVSGMLKNAIYGIAAAKASGNSIPTIGILNIDGARHLERALRHLKDNGFPIKFTESARSDGGVVMRGNDLLLGVPDIMVTDSLTGNVLMKMFSAFSSGGNYESTGYGYGPGIGEKYDRVICILSRASGAPVVANAIKYAGDLAKGKLLNQVEILFAEAKKAGLNELISSIESSSSSVKKYNVDHAVTPPPAKIVTDDIPGIEILELDEAAQLLWKNGIYATTGMGCTGPIVQIAEEDKEAAVQLLKEHKFIG